MAQVGLPEDEARGERLRELRDGLNESQTAVAEATGLSTGGLRIWERGGRIGLGSLHTLARHYRVNPNWITTGEGDKRPAASGELLDRVADLEEAVRARPSAEEFLGLQRAVGSLATLVLEPDLDPAARLLLRHELSAARQWSTSEPTTEEPAPEGANR